MLEENKTWIYVKNNFFYKFFYFSQKYISCQKRCSVSNGPDLCWQFYIDWRVISFQRSYNDTNDTSAEWLFMKTIRRRCCLFVVVRCRFYNIQCLSSFTHNWCELSKEFKSTKLLLQFNFYWRRCYLVSPNKDGGDFKLLSQIF